MTTIVTIEGDTIDGLVAEHYGVHAVSTAIPSVLEANIGLADRGNTLPAGLRIVLPDQSAITSERPPLW